MITDRDRAWGWVSLSCTEQEHHRCRRAYPEGEHRDPGPAPFCSCPCHEDKPAP